MFGKWLFFFSFTFTVLILSIALFKKRNFEINNVYSNVSNSHAPVENGVSIIMFFVLISFF